MIRSSSKSLIEDAYVVGAVSDETSAIYEIETVAALVGVGRFIVLVGKNVVEVAFAKEGGPWAVIVFWICVKAKDYFSVVCLFS